MGMRSFDCYGDNQQREKQNMTRSMLKRKSKLVRDNPINSLAKMLSTMRPANSHAVDAFVDDWILPLGAKLDYAGNAIIRIGDNSRVLWSCHTDTVHRNEGIQRVSVNGDFFKVAHGQASSCLGADCTTGVWLMREMILAGVNGLYVFHAGEEIGGIGSSWLAKNNAGLFDGIDYAIAFDRKGYDSVITHQLGGRCASDAFAASIALQLPDAYKKDDTGTFTDTANYTDLVSECTNLSVGYFAQHTAGETQSISHAIALREAMLAFDETKLVKSRVAGEADDAFAWAGYYRMSKKGNYQPSYYDHYDDYDDGRSRYYASLCDGFHALADYVQLNADGVADFLEAMGFTLKDLREHIDGKGYKG
jgi:hypothetical protein